MHEIHDIGDDELMPFLGHDGIRNLIKTGIISPWIYKRGNFKKMIVILEIIGTFLKRA